MATSTLHPFDLAPVATPLDREAESSAVAWPAVLAGSVVIAAFSLMLLSLGAGFGLAIVSPWSGSGVSAPVFGSISITWMLLATVLASSLGGFLTGRLRTRWVALHADEVYFRDTANGFLAWGVAFVLTLALLASASVWMAGSVAQNDSVAPDTTRAYFVDSLFRGDRLDTELKARAENEASRILTRAALTEADQLQLSRLVARVTGMDRAGSDRRVSDVTVCQDPLKWSSRSHTNPAFG